MISTSVNQWFIFGLLACVVFLKELLFQGLVFRDLYFRNFQYAYKFYGSTIAIAIVIASFTLLFRHQWWSLAILLLIDVWFISQIVYYRSWGLWMNVQVIKMVDNMSGFWSSVLTLLNWKSFIFLLMTFLYLPFLIVYEHNICASDVESYQCHWKIFLCMLAVSYCYVPIRQYNPWIRYEKEHAKVKNPYTDPIRYHVHNLIPLLRPYNEIFNTARLSYRGGGIIPWEDRYIQQHGMIDYAFAMVIFQISYNRWKNQAYETFVSPFNENDYSVLSKLIREEQHFVPKRNLVFILVESFESWVIDYHYKEEYAMPNLRHFLEQYKTFYADKITSQVRGGGSGDGQLIAMTGMLPLQSGAACREYAQNTYPNFAHCFPHSITLNPSPGAWNQREVNPSYGFKDLYESFPIGEDEYVIEELVKRLQTIEQPYCILTITLSTHNPFHKAKDINWDLDPKMPTNMAKYIKCMRYLDNQFGKLFAELEHLDKLQNTDLVITGDHIIFQKMILHEMIDYAKKNNVKIENNQNYCPLIIYSPTIKDNIRNASVSYQMDIFPTIMHAIGNNGYWWKGFGIDLFDKCDRLLSEEEAFVLSDKIIRTNYFNKRQ